MFLLLLLMIISCGAKKKHIKKFKSASKVEFIQNVIEEKKFVEINVSEAKNDSKKESEINFSEANFNIVADKLIITNKDGSVSEFINPKINKSLSNLNQKTKDESYVLKKDSLAKKEENKAKSESNMKSNEEYEVLKKDIATDQFNWGKLVLQLCAAGVVIYGCWRAYKWFNIKL